MFNKDLTPKKIKTQHIVTFAEIDPFGHMSSQHYLRYYNAHRSEGSKKTLGLGLKEFSQWPIIFPITEMNIKYLAPLFADQEFEIESFVKSVGEMDCQIYMKMTRKEKLMSEAVATYVCVDKVTGKKMAWPAGTMENFFSS